VWATAKTCGFLDGCGGLLTKLLICSMSESFTISGNWLEQIETIFGKNFLYYD
jgi:hypothetical protein